MDPRQWLVNFMWIKRAALIWATGGAPEAVNYFTEADANAISTWSFEEASRVANIMQYQVERSRYLNPIISIYCPFCEKHDDECNNCEYADNRDESCYQNYATGSWDTNYKALSNMLIDFDLRLKLMDKFLEGLSSLDAPLTELAA